MLEEKLLIKTLKDTELNETSEELNEFLDDLLEVYTSTDLRRELLRFTSVSAKTTMLLTIITLPPSNSRENMSKHLAYSASMVDLLFGIWLGKKYAHIEVMEKVREDTE